MSVNISLIPLSLCKAAHCRPDGMFHDYITAASLSLYKVQTHTYKLTKGVYQLVSIVKNIYMIGDIL